MTRPPSSSLSPPDSADELLRCLRSAHLLSPRRARALGRRWAADPHPVDCEARVRELLAAGVLTRYQAGQVLAGRARRLRLGPYRVLDRLGGGGMGHVYKAEHVLMRRVVALKVVARLPQREERGAATTTPAGKPSRRELIARFRREVRSAGRMSHPNVVTAFDAGVARGFLFLVMEYVDGIDLGRYVTENGPLPVPLACEAVRQAALALQYAHDRGLVHRDIKPDNLLLTWPDPQAPSVVGSLPSLPDGTSGEGAAVVKLLDLGLALPVRLPAERAEPAGTPDFMAPEQAHGRSPVDGRSDLYSLGCTFYYLLTGRVPYPGGTCAEKLVRHGFDVPSAIHDLRPNVPAAVIAIVDRLMAKNPTERYPGPGAVAAVLGGLADHGWNLGTPPPLRPALGRGRGSLPDTLPTHGELLDVNRPVNETPSVPSLPELPYVPAPVAPAAAEPTAAEPTAPQPAAPPAPATRGLPSIPAVLAAVAFGALLGLVAVRMPFALPQSAPGASTPAELVIGVERGGNHYATLAEALATAETGDTLTIRGPGPYRLAPTDLGDKALTLRAAGRARPVIEPKDGDASGPWQALLATSGALTLEGLDFTTANDAPLVAGTGATLRLTDCRLTPAGAGPAVVARGGDLHVRTCRVRAATAALAVEADGVPCTLDVADSQVAVADPAGAAVAVWAPETSRPAAVHLLLERNVVSAGRVAAFRALGGPLRVEANDNDLTFHDALASFSEYTRGASWRRATTWTGRDNRCHAKGYWLSVDGRAVAVHDDAGWQKLWADRPAAAAPEEVSALPASRP